MKLTLVVLSIALVAGMLAGGRLSNLASVRIRWTVLALLGLALQVVPVPGAVLPLALLYASFALLAVFAVRNLRLAGFVLILVGLASNFTVIAVNGGMPVTRHALVASGQADTLSLLVRDGGAKHHLASSSDSLLPLGDVIPIKGVDQAVSVGDVLTYLGVMWLIVWCMLRRAPAVPEGSPELPSEFLEAELVRS
jgi:hypothetical protein